MENIRNNENSIEKINDTQQFANNLAKLLKDELGIDITKPEHTGLLRIIDVERDSEFDEDYISEKYALWKGNEPADVLSVSFSSAELNQDPLTPLSESQKDTAKRHDRINLIKSTAGYGRLETTRAERDEEIIKNRDAEINAVNEKLAEKIKERDRMVKELEGSISGDSAEAAEDDAAFHAELEAKLDADLDLVSQWIRSPKSADLSKLSTLGSAVIKRPFQEKNNQSAEEYYNSQKEASNLSEMRFALRSIRDILRSQKQDAFEYEFQLQRQAITDKYQKMLAESERKFNTDVDDYFTEHHGEFSDAQIAERYFSDEDAERLHKLGLLYGAGSLFVVRPGSRITDPENSFMISADDENNIKLIPLKDVKGHLVQEYIDEIKAQDLRNQNKAESRDFFWNCRFNDIHIDTDVSMESVENFNTRLPENVSLNDAADIRRFFMMTSDGLLVPVTDGQYRDDLEAIPSENGRDKMEQWFNISAINGHINAGHDVFYADKDGKIIPLADGGDGKIVSNDEKPAIGWFMSTFRGIIEYFAPDYYAEYDRKMRTYEKLQSVRDRFKEDPDALIRLTTERDAGQTIDKLAKYGCISEIDCAAAKKDANPLSFQLSNGSTIREAADVFATAESEAQHIVAAFNTAPTNVAWNTHSQEIKDNVAESVTKAAVDFEMVRSRMVKWARNNPEGKMPLSFDDAKKIGKFMCIERAMNTPDFRKGLLTSLSNPANTAFDEAQYAETMTARMNAGGFSSSGILKIFGRHGSAAYNAFAQSLLTESLAASKISREMSDISNKPDAERLQHLNEIRQREAKANDVSSARPQVSDLVTEQQGLIAD